MTQKHTYTKKCKLHQSFPLFATVPHRWTELLLIVNYSYNYSLCTLYNFNVNIVNSCWTPCAQILHYIGTTVSGKITPVTRFYCRGVGGLKLYVYTFTIVIANMKPLQYLNFVSLQIRRNKPNCSVLMFIGSIIDSRFVYLFSFQTLFSTEGKSMTNHISY